MNKELKQLIAQGSLIDPRAGENILDIFSRCYSMRGLEKSIVFFIIDGLGMNLSAMWPRNGFFQENYQKPINAVYPSTTACALTSFSTLKPVGMNGITGWDTAIPEHGNLCTLLPYQEKMTRDSYLGFSEINNIILPPSVRPADKERIITITPGAYIGGEYEKWTSGESEVIGYENFEEGFYSLVSVFTERTNKPAFVYFYIPDVDHMEHHEGITSPNLAPLLKTLDTLLADSYHRIGDMAHFAVSADHGLKEVQGQQIFIIQQDDPVYEYLLVPVSAEVANPVFHIIPGREPEFRKYFTERFGEYFILIPSREIASSGFLGTTDIPETMLQRMGTFWGIAKKPAILMQKLEKFDLPDFRGVHGGLSPHEMRIPLFIAGDELKERVIGNHQ